MDKQEITLAVIGGGAAGLSAAIAAGQRAKALNIPLQVIIYECDDRVGRSILATGNGRCNFSNADIDVALYHNANFVQDAFRSLQQISDSSNPVHKFFRSLGLVWREEVDGRQFPLANKASVVLDVLRAAAAELGVYESCDKEVAAIDPPREPAKPFTLRMKNGVLKRADSVIIASGGRTVFALDAAVLPRKAPKPLLGPLAVCNRDKNFVRELDNIRLRTTISLLRKNEKGEFYILAEEAGELMFRKYGVSGICVFNLSRHAAQGDYLSINFLGQDSLEETERFLLERRDLLVPRYGENLTYADMLRGILLPRVFETLLKQQGIHPRDTFTKEDANELGQLLFSFLLKVEGIADANLCQVRRGGFDVSAIDANTMAAKDVPGLFVAGEALDVDGPCGGYNLQWAWASGLIAGVSAVDGFGQIIRFTDKKSGL